MDYFQMFFKTNLAAVIPKQQTSYYSGKLTKQKYRSVVLYSYFNNSEQRRIFFLFYILVIHYCA